MGEYTLFVTEEIIFNEELRDWRAGRIELRDGEHPHSIDEARFLVPDAIYEDVIKELDGKEVSVPLLIDMDFEEDSPDE